MRILLIGLNHRSAPVELRERVAFSREEACRAADELRAKRILEEAVVLSTCNRSELYGVPPEEAADPAAALECYFAAFHQLSPAALDGCLYRRHDADAVRHLFRVAAGLDSMLLGEAEILGQVREAYRAAFEGRATGPALNRLFQSALDVGKRVRAETELGARPMSVAMAAVKLAERIFGKLRGHKALVIGAGAMGAQVVEQMRERGLSEIRVANRSRERAEELAGRVGGRAVEWERLPGALEPPDVVLASVSDAGQLLTRAMVERAMAARANRVMFVIDLGVPRNVEPAAGELYNVYVYNIDDLSGIVEQNKKAREREVPRAEAIVEGHVAKYADWQASVEAVAVLRELGEKLRRQGEEFLAKRLDEMGGLSPDDRRRVLALAQEMMDGILAEPAQRLHRAGELRQKLEEAEALRRLFALEKEKP